MQNINKEQKKPKELIIRKPRKTVAAGWHPFRWNGRLLARQTGFKHTVLESNRAQGKQ